MANSIGYFKVQGFLKYNCKFSYDKVVYRNSKTPVIITCPIHGDFLQRPDVHLDKNAKSACKKCISFKTHDDWLEKFRTIHGFKYTYVFENDIIDADTMLTIRCGVHGYFTQSVRNHITGRGCKACAHDYKSLLFRLTKEELISRFKNIHGSKYNYLGLDYKNRNGKVFYRCPVHGEVSQSIGGHLAGKGCRQCHKGGFNTGMEGYLYFIKRKDEHVMKIGICNVLDKRMGSLKEVTPFDFEIVRVFKFENGKECADIEKLCHSCLTRAGYRGFNGCTEWFTINDSLINLLDFPTLVGATIYV